MIVWKETSENKPDEGWVKAMAKKVKIMCMVVGDGRSRSLGLNNTSIDAMRKQQGKPTHEQG